MGMFLYAGGWAIFFIALIVGGNALTTTGLSVSGAIFTGSMIIAGSVSMAGGAIAEAIARK